MTWQALDLWMGLTLPTLTSGQNGWYFADNFFKCICLNEDFWIPAMITLKCIPKGSIDNKTSIGSDSVTWRRLGEPMIA